MARKYIAGQLTGSDFRRIRQGLLLTQLELAKILGYAHKIRISEFERPTNPSPIPLHIQSAMIAMWNAGGVSPVAPPAVRAWERRDQAA